MYDLFVIIQVCKPRPARVSMSRVRSFNSKWLRLYAIILTEVSDEMGSYAKILRKFLLV